jgi:protoheme IX farnesyltransferase
MQMLHLFVADVIWVQLVLFCASAMSADQPAPESDAAVGVRPAEFGSATWRDYLALTKPRIISLLLLTTLAAMFIAAGGWPGGWLLLAVSIGGYAAAGAANAINMVIERDLDARMERTAGRPTVTERIPAQRALAFAFALGLAGFALLWSAANLLAAVLAFAGLVFYVIVYTLALKRRTWQNIVIGGAAGAFPPLVGWSAVTGELHLLAWYLFAIVFFWTPVHFWALALIMKDEYALAGIPMLPVVRGDRVTVIQIALYTLLTIVISLMPLAQRLVGPFYFSAAVVLNLVLLVRAAQLFQIPERPRARSLFKYSMAYLALLFLAMAIDRSLAAKTSTHSDEHPSPASRVSS